MAAWSLLLVWEGSQTGNHKKGKCIPISTEVVFKAVKIYTIHKPADFLLLLQFKTQNLFISDTWIPDLAWTEGSPAYGNLSFLPNTQGVKEKPQAEMEEDI